MFSKFHPDILRTLLIDRTRTYVNKTHNIIWATSEYAGHLANSEICLEDLNHDKVFANLVNTTPNLTIDYMNRLIDQRSVNYPTNQNNWHKYVLELRMEVTCGLAPFAADRRRIELQRRSGFLDHKMQVVSKYSHDSDEWLTWAKMAYQSSYGYELRGDYLILARINLLKSFIDYWNDKFPGYAISLKRQLSQKHLTILLDLAEIISWNFFQMDGISYTIPLSCRRGCLGCKKHKPQLHSGRYVEIMDWRKKKVQKFIELLD